MVGLKVPTLFIGAPPPPMMTAKVGNTFCVTLRVFSVVNCSSSVPAPMPTA